MKIQKKNFGGGGGPVGGGGGGVGGSVGGVGLGWGVRVDVNEIEVFCENSKKKIIFFGGGGVGGGGGSGWGVRVDVNEELKLL